MTTRSAEKQASRPFSALWGALLAGAIVALTGLKLALHLRGWLGLPDPNPIPLEFRADRSFSPTYWLPWLMATAMLIAPGTLMLLGHRIRRVGIGYLLTASLLTVPFALFFISLEYGGFAPD